ncbi:MAG: tetratricopeptide repeat protein [Candidatus Gracilibacteria bacterium]|jgi:tetratricopeptide (TPR) repeat protein
MNTFITWTLWILVLVSGLVTVGLFLRRLKCTYKDLLFQKHDEDEVAREEKEMGLNEETDDCARAQTESEISSPSNLTDVENAGAIFARAKNTELGDEKTEEIKPDRSAARKMFLKAEALLSRGEMEEAMQGLLAAIQADPMHLDAHHKLGLIFMKKGDFPSAELYFSKLVNLKQDPVYFSNLGAALYEQKRLVEAAEAYENAVAIDDRRAERLQSLAQVYHELGETEKALHYFERSARRKPKDIDLKLILADYYEKLGRPEDSARMLKEVLVLDPYNEEVRSRVG